MSSAAVAAVVLVGAAAGVRSDDADCGVAYLLVPSCTTFATARPASSNTMMRSGSRPPSTTGGACCCSSRSADATSWNNSHNTCRERTCSRAYAVSVGPPSSDTSQYFGCPDVRCDEMPRVRTILGCRNTHIGNRLGSSSSARRGAPELPTPEAACASEMSPAPAERTPHTSCQYARQRHVTSCHTMAAGVQR